MKLSILAAICAVTLAAPAAAQSDYPPSDSRSSQYQEYLRQEREKTERNAADQRLQEETAANNAANYATFMENQHRLQAKLSGQVEEDRAMFLQTPPLPVQRNGLIGRWKLDTTKTATDNPFAELNAMISQPTCELVFGGGIWDFRPKALWSNDEGFGEHMMTEIDYRGNEGIVGVVPKTFMRLLVFKVVDRNRVQELTSTRIGADPCTFVRVGGGSQVASSTAPSSRATSSMASSAMPPAAVPPPRPTSSRPSREVCAMTLLDKLGVAGVNQVRAMSDVRFKEPAIEGVAPGLGGLRIDLRGSTCDDPRILATLYDFDKTGILRAVTYLWKRPPGPAPAPIFTERREALSRFHTLPPPQGPGRLQADTSLGRLILEDKPERDMLLEAYLAKK